MIDASAENAKTLAALMGTDEQEAASVLDIDVLVQHDSSPEAKAIAGHVATFLRRTVRNVGLVSRPAIAVAVGLCTVSGPWPVVRVLFDGIYVQIGAKAAGVAMPPISGPGAVVVACYAAGAAVRLACSSRFALPMTDPVRLDPRAVEVPDFFNFDETHLAGAGAISNGFVYTLAQMRARGRLNVVDPKLVTPGNLNRCVFFDESDVGRPKAQALVTRAARYSPDVELVPHVTELSKLAPNPPGAWLRRLVVGVDSRPARRHLQEELPREVFDASTTGMEEVVLHFNDRLGPSCLACTYYEDAQEGAHERHVAEILGVSVEQVRAQFIDSTTASLIANRYPQLPPDALLGRAFDSIFKALCGTGSLTPNEGRTVLAPLSFVSILAGAWLAIEFARRVTAGSACGSFNSWRLSPWASPVTELRQNSTRRRSCSCCGQGIIRGTVDRLWG